MFVCLVCGLTYCLTAMVMSRWLVNLTTLLASLDKAVNQYSVQILLLVADQFPKVWGWAGIEPMTPGLAIRLTTDCTTGPCMGWSVWQLDFKYAV